MRGSIVGEERCMRESEGGDVGEAAGNIEGDFGKKNGNIEGDCAKACGNIEGDFAKTCGNIAGDYAKMCGLIKRVLENTYVIISRSTVIKR